MRVFVAIPILELALRFVLSMLWFGGCEDEYILAQTKAQSEIVDSGECFV